MKPMALMMLGALPLAALPLAAQRTEPLSDSAKAVAVVARHRAAIVVTGAPRATRDVHTVTVMTTLTPDGVEVRYETWVQPPRYFTRTEYPGLETIESGFDGTTAWSMSSRTGPVIHKESPASLLNVAAASGVEAGGRMTYAGRREIGGRTFDAVRVVLPDSKVATQYYDVGTGLLSGMDLAGQPAPPGHMSVEFSDYRRFGDLLQHTTSTIRVGGQVMVMRTLSMSFDPIDPRTFELPPAVRALMARSP